MLPDDAPVDSDAGPPTSSTPSAHSDGSTRPRGASRGFRKIMMYRWSIGFGNTPAAHGSRLAMSTRYPVSLASRARRARACLWTCSRVSNSIQRTPVTRVALRHPRILSLLSRLLYPEKRTWQSPTWQCNASPRVSRKHHGHAHRPQAARATYPLKSLTGATVQYGTLVHS